MASPQSSLSQSRFEQFPAVQTDKSLATDLSKEQDGSVLKWIVSECSNSARPTTGNKVQVHYTCYLQDHKALLSSTHNDQPLIFPNQFNIGRGQVRLLGIEGEDISPKQDKSIIRTLVTDGQSFKRANLQSVVTVRISGRCQDEQLLADSQMQFCVQECEAYDLPFALQHALLRMNEGEECCIELYSPWLYDSDTKQRLALHGRHDMSLPLTYNITLLHIHKEPQIWRMNPTQKLQEGERVKQKATEYLKMGKYALAIDRLAYALQVINIYDTENNIHKDALSEWSANQMQCNASLECACHMNTALCHLRLTQPSECLNSLECALKLQPNNAKAVFRQAQAYEQQKEYRKAAKNYAKVLQIDPDNKAAFVHRHRCAQLATDQYTQNKAHFNKHYNKLIVKDEPKVAVKETAVLVEQVNKEEHRRAQLFPSSVKPSEEYIEMDEPETNEPYTIDEGALAKLVQMVSKAKGTTTGAGAAPAPATQIQESVMPGLITIKDGVEVEVELEENVALAVGQSSKQTEAGAKHKRDVLN